MKQEKEGALYFIPADGAGFNMAFTQKLFSAFQCFYTQPDAPEQVSG